MSEPSEVQRMGPACGVQGCLFAAVAIFVLLLIGTLVVGIFRFSEPPAGPPRPPVSMAPVPAPERAATPSLVPPQVVEGGAAHA